MNIRARPGMSRDGLLLPVMSGCAFELAIYDQAASGSRLVVDMPRGCDE
jgi:hypothetical protein